MEFFVKQFFLIFPLFPRCGGNWFPHYGNTIPQFSSNFPPNFPINTPISMIPTDSYWLPLILKFPVQFSIQLHNCTSSLSIKPILCILHVSLKMRIPYYARQRIINLGNSVEIQGNSGEIRRKAFHSLLLVFPGAKYISLKIGEIQLPWFLQWLPWKLVKTTVKKEKGNSLGNGNSHSFSFPPPPYKFQLHITRVGVNSGIEWELSSIPDSIPGIGLGIGIEKKGIGIELELTKNARNW